jgi:hypothetical protein
MPPNPCRPTRRRPTRYRIVVRGELSQRYSTAFEGMSLVAEDGQTVITGPVIDQAHLHGLLDRISDFGLELVSVNATPEPEPEPPAPDRTSRR